MAVISPNLVLGAEVASNNPVIGIDSRVTAASLEATTSAPGRPVTNLANASTAEHWAAANRRWQFLTCTLMSGEEIDYVGLARHNFASAGIAVTVQGYAETGDNGEPDWRTIAGPVIPASDGALLIRFQPFAYEGIRVRLSPGSSPARCAVLHAGPALVLERRIYVGHTPMPYGRVTRTTDNVSENGQFLGRIVRHETLETGFTMENITPAFYRDHLDAFIAEAVRRPFFFAWRPGDYAHEVGYAWFAKTPRPVNQRPNGMMQVQFSLKGIA